MHLFESESYNREVRTSSTTKTTPSLHRNATTALPASPTLCAYLLEKHDHPHGVLHIYFTVYD